MILNNFDLSVRFDREHRFPSRNIQSWQKFACFAKFLQSGQNSPTLQAPGGETVHPSELFIDMKVVQNGISDNFYFDLSIVRTQLKWVIFYFFKTMIYNAD